MVINIVSSTEEKGKRWSGRISLKKGHAKGSHLDPYAGGVGRRVLEEEQVWSSEMGKPFQSYVSHIVLFSQIFAIVSYLYCYLGDSITSSYVSHGPGFLKKILKERPYGRCCIITISFKLEWRKLVFFGYKIQHFQCFIVYSFWKCFLPSKVWWTVLSFWFFFL